MFWKGRIPCDEESQLLMILADLGSLGEFRCCTVAINSGQVVLLSEVFGIMDVTVTLQQWEAFKMEKKKTTKTLTSTWAVLYW